ncbi:MAG: M56 family metallopeptidase [Saprospiraceae bacterium]
MISIDSSIQYLFEVSFCLLAFYLFYHWILRKETFFRFNRFYLLLTPFISLLIPSFQTGQIKIVQQQTPQSFEFIPQAIQGFQQSEIIFSEKINTTSLFIDWTYGDIIGGIYVFVVLLFLGKLLRNIWAVRQLIKSNAIEKTENYTQVILPNIKTPFSFFNYLFWNGKNNYEAELMLAHEQVHIRERHSIDVIIMEILVAFFWFHPLVYFFRKASKMTHEYLADQNVTEIFGKRKEYASLLLANATQSFAPLASTFNSFIKNRLDMIYKEKNSSNKLWKLLAILPLFLALTLLFSCDQVNSLKNDPVGKIINQAEVASQEVLKKQVVKTGIGDVFKTDLNSIKESFDVLFQVDQLNEMEYNLSTTIILNKESYIISPFSKDTTYGHFYFTLPNNEHFVSDNQLLETPNSVEEFDPILEAPVKFVRVNTTYQRKIKLTGQDDFEVTGIVEFLLEPICIPYDVQFKISYKNGKMNVEKTKTVISSEYKM